MRGGIFLALALAVPPLRAWAATYYISPDGAHDADGSLSAPFGTFARAFSTMSAGDELVLLDGLYSDETGTGYIHYDDGSCAACGQPPSGKGPGAETVVRAQNPGAVVVDGGAREGLFLGRGAGGGFQKARHIRVQDITFEGGGSLYNTSRVAIKACGFHRATEGDGAVFGIGTNDGNWGNDHNLVEDCWIWGRERIIAINYRAGYNVWRRVVVRGDGCAGGGCAGAGNPNVGFTVYNSSHVSVQNLIVLDRRLDGGEPYGDFATAQHVPGPSVNMGAAEHLSHNEWLGCLSLNSEDSGFHFEADAAGPATVIIRDAVAWHNGGLNFNPGRQAKGFILENITAGISGPRSDGVRVAPGLTDGVVRNLLVHKSGRFGVNSAVAPSYVNVTGAGESAYNQTRCAEGCGKTDPLKPAKGPPALRHITRVEPGSALSGKGYQKRDYGARLIHRYGADGSRYGDKGYNDLTDQSLWPWPYEERIRQDMCAEETRGFCGAGSLTGYIWSYLGTPSPYPDPPKASRRAARPKALPPRKTAAVPTLAAPVPQAAPAPAPKRTSGFAAKGGLELRPEETISFGPEAAHVAIHDHAGDVVFESAKRGDAEMSWDGKDARGRRVTPGLYISRVKTVSGQMEYRPVQVR